MKIMSTIIFLLLLCLSMSTVTAQIDWKKDSANNPVLEPGLSGDFDDYSLFPACILFDGSTYHLWFGGHDGIRDRIGYAESPDGITWTKYAGNPVLDVGPSGSWDDERIMTPYVLFDGNTYHMWYGGYNGTNTRIGYATSTDRTTWIKYEGNPVMNNGPAGSWESIDVNPDCILFDGSTYHMWYSGYNVSGIGCIGYATSSDGITWIKDKDNPVLKPDAGTWDRQMVSAPDVFFDGSTYHMWYTGSTTSSWWQWGGIGYATAPDGINWTKDAGNPIFSPDAGEWDSQFVGFSRVIWDSTNSQYKMWYGGGNSNWYGKLGYATSQDTITTGLSEAFSAVLPNYFELKQNYPNPFNPTTIINYELPTTNDVELSIYNLLGQKVVTLVSQKQKAGHHQVEWNAAGLASGVYYYNLKAGEFQDVKKMILLR